MLFKCHGNEECFFSNVLTFVTVEETIDFNQTSIAVLKPSLLSFQNSNLQDFIKIINSFSEFVDTKTISESTFPLKRPK